MRAAADRQLAEEYMNRELSRGITESALLERENHNLGVVGRVFDDEHPELAIHCIHPRTAGASLSTSQYIWSWLMAAAKRVKSTGLRT